MIDIAKVQRIFNEEYEGSDGDMLYYIRDMAVDSLITFDYAEVPEGWVFTVKEVDDELNRDSYGYGYREDAKLIFVVSDSDSVKTFAIPGTYASFEGWSWELDKLKEVRPATKSVTYWEEVNG